MNNTKYIIIGSQCTGKMSIYNKLKSFGVKTGDIFRSKEDIGKEYSISTIVYNLDDINKIFELNSYLFIKESLVKNNRNKYWEGLSFYDWDNNDVFVMTLDQFYSVAEFPSNTVFIWVDNNTVNRKNKYWEDKREYDFNKRELVEKEFIQNFTQLLYEYPVLYFFNEDPDRVATIIYSLVKYPDLLDLYKENFK